MKVPSTAYPWLVAALGFAILLVGAAAFNSTFAAIFGVVIAAAGFVWGLWGKGTGEDDNTDHWQERRAVPAGLRRKIYDRAKHRCQFPSCDVKGGKQLDVHHVNMDRSDSLDENNLIAVCPNHHREIHNSSAVTIPQVRNWARGRYGSTTGKQGR